MKVHSVEQTGVLKGKHLDPSLHPYLVMSVNIWIQTFLIDSSLLENWKQKAKQKSTSITAPSSCGDQACYQQPRDTGSKVLYQLFCRQKKRKKGGVGILLNFTFLLLSEKNESLVKSFLSRHLLTHAQSTELEPVIDTEIQTESNGKIVCFVQLWNFDACNIPW